MSIELESFAGNPTPVTDPFCPKSKWPAFAVSPVESHGGRIWAENLPGGGARVAFVIGGEQAAAPETEHHDERSIEPHARPHVAV